MRGDSEFFHILYRAGVLPVKEALGCPFLDRYFFVAGKEDKRGVLRTSNLLFSSNITSGPRSMVIWLDLMPRVSCLGRWISMVVELLACILSPTSSSSSEPPQRGKFSQSIYDSMSELSWAV